MCDCIERMYLPLRDRNTRLGITWILGSHDRISIVTEQVEKGRGKPKATNVISSYCPICGDKYPDEKTEQQ